MTNGLTFYYGTMSSSKTADALMLRHQLIEKGYNVYLMKPACDSRDDEVDEAGNRKTVIKSRVGLKAEAIIIDEQTDIRTLIDSTKRKLVIIVDEAQFLKAEQVTQLRRIADEGAKVICYGLRTNFVSSLFSGAARLFELADKVSELHTVFCDCGAPAIINARLTSLGTVTLRGEEVDVGAEEKYKPMCYKCWLAQLKEAGFYEEM